jgi:hypothetical protein
VSSSEPEPPSATSDESSKAGWRAQDAERSPGPNSSSPFARLSFASCSRSFAFLLSFVRLLFVSFGSFLFSVAFLFLSDRSERTYPWRVVIRLERLPFSSLLFRCRCHGLAKDFSGSSFFLMRRPFRRDKEALGNGSRRARCHSRTIASSPVRSDWVNR